MTSAVPSPEDVRAFYDRLYQTQGIRDPLWLYRWIVRLLTPQPGQRLLDVACGEGHVLRFATQAGLIAEGVDISPEAVRMAKARAPRATVQVADGEHLPFPEATFDYVVNLGSLEHYLHMDVGVQEMARVLRPTGLACVMLPNTFWLGGVMEVMGHGGLGEDFQLIERHGTRRQWQQLLEANGLQVIRTVRYNKPYPLFDEETHKIKSLRKFLWRGFFNRACPFNLSLAFVYLCRQS